MNVCGIIEFLFVDGVEIGMFVELVDWIIEVDKVFNF